MPGASPFTRRRLLKFIKDFKVRTGELPTFRDLEDSHFDRETIKQAVKEKLIEELFVTLTNGSIVKGFRIR